MDKESTICPHCGETTKQMLRGWDEGSDTYRCGHCKKAYKIERMAKEIR